MFSRKFSIKGPLAPFLFLLMVDGLGALIRRAEELGEFKWFKIGNAGLMVSRH